MTKPSFYVTTPIYYPSGNLHIGHTYTTVAADAIARFKRFCGYDVKFLTGTDEHGEKIQKTAREKGMKEIEYLDGMIADIKKLWNTMDISYDDFIRTTQDRHKVIIQKIFTKLYEQGDIYKGSYEGRYCTPCESFWTESQLLEGNKCPDCGRDTYIAKEEAYFFKLSKYEDRLRELFADPNFCFPVSRKNEMVANFLDKGLEDLCVTRTTFDWGIKVPFDEKHVIYVWVDALCNYITALGYMSENDADYKKFWPANVHIVGKEIMRFHTIIWPAILMALGEEVPTQVYGHGWILFDNDKMSKSKGNVLYADELVDFFGVDAVRYFVLHEMPFENDGVISWELMVERLNSDLANTLGNLVNRTISMTNKYFGGTVTDKGVAEEVDADLKAVTENTPKAVEAKMNELRVADAITEIFNLFKRCNKYIDETMPWALAKEEDKKDRLETVLWNLIQSISEGAKLLESFMPETAEKILAQLGGGHVVEKPEILFQRLDLEEVMKKVEELHPKVEEEKKEEEEGIDIEAKPEITFEDFEKMQFQVGEIISCEAVKKSKKLLCSQVKIGSQVKQIVSGIKAHYTPEEMVGKKVMVLVNLKPAKLAGVLSEGMLLCAEDADGNLALMTPEKKMPAGAEIC